MPRAYRAKPNQFPELTKLGPTIAQRPRAYKAKLDQHSEITKAKPDQCPGMPGDYKAKPDECLDFTRLSQSSAQSLEGKARRVPGAQKACDERSKRHPRPAALGL